MSANTIEDEDVTIERVRALWLEQHPEPTRLTDEGHAAYYGRWLDWSFQYDELMFALVDGSEGPIVALRRHCMPDMAQWMIEQAFPKLHCACIYWNREIYLGFGASPALALLQTLERLYAQLDFMSWRMPESTAAAPSKLHQIGVRFRNIFMRAIG